MLFVVVCVVECYFTSTETIGPRQPPRLSHSSRGLTTWPWFSFLSTGLVFSHHCVLVATDSQTVSDQGNKGPHQDQIFDNLSALCLALWAKNQVPAGGAGGGGGETDAPSL